MRLRNNIFASAFDELKRNHGIKTQKELARRMGVSEDTITRILKDRTEVTEDIITKLQSASGCIFNFQWLRGEDPFHMLAKDVEYSPQPSDEPIDHSASISLTPDKWYYGLDYLTGDAVTAKRQPITVNVPESYVGTIGEIAVSVFGLSGANEWTTNVSVNAADLGGITIGSAQIIGAPFKRNRATEYHGALFGAAGSMVVSVNNDWDDSVTGTW